MIPRRENLEHAAEPVVENSAIILSPVPQIHALLETGIEQAIGSERESATHYIGRTYVNYLRVIRYMSHFSPEDIRIITAAEQRIATASSNKKGSGSEYSPVQIFNAMGPVRQQALGVIALDAADINSPIFLGAIQDLTLRMQEGSKLFEQGQSPNDTNPAFKHAIYGHVKGMQPRAMVHFCICHFLGRAFQAQYGAGQNDPLLETIANDKDSFYNLLSSTIRLMVARGVCPPEVNTMWTTTRENGGVQWHANRENPNAGDPLQHFYNDAVRERKQSKSS